MEEQIHAVRKALFRHNGIATPVLEIERHKNGETVCVYRMPFPSAYPDKESFFQPFGYLETPEAHRRRGHGTAILQSVENILQAHANKTGKPIIWKPHANENSVGLIEKLGFEPVSQRGPGNVYTKRIKPGTPVTLTPTETRALQLIREHLADT